MKKYSQKDNNNSLVESVYSIIKNRKRKVTTKYLENEIGSKYKVRYSVTRLIKEGKIKRIRPLGRARIESFYEDTWALTFPHPQVNFHDFIKTSILIILFITLVKTTQINYKSKMMYSKQQE